MKRLRDYFTKEEILTVPNLLSLVRILLIPVCVYTYIGRKNYTLTAAIVVLSALTDIVDGWIARRFRMTSNIGKALDPFADKLTQIVILFCLVSRYPYILGLGVLLAAGSVFVIQGALVLLSSVLAPLLSDMMIAEMTAAGSLMIIGIGLNLTGITKLKVADYLPAILYAPFIGLLFQALGIG